MININLVAEKKQKQGKPKGGSKVQEDSGNSGQSLLLVGILIIGLVAAGGWWWTLNSQIDSVQDRIEKADAELKRLEEIRRKNEEYKARKDLLARKIDLITELKKQQAVPVHIMDQVSKNLPDYLWLDSMSAASNLITITGKATSYNAVSTFYTNLSQAGYFVEVTLGRTFEVVEGVQFSLTCKFAFDNTAKAKGQEEDPQG